MFLLQRIERRHTVLQQLLHFWLITSFTAVACLQVISGSRNNSGYFNDVWAWKINTGTWEQWSAENEVAPIGRDHFGAVYDAGHVYIFGAFRLLMHSNMVCAVSSTVFCICMRPSVASSTVLWIRSLLCMRFLMPVAQCSVCIHDASMFALHHAAANSLDRPTVVMRFVCVKQRQCTSRFLHMWKPCPERTSFCHLSWPAASPGKPLAQC